MPKNYSSDEGNHKGYQLNLLWSNKGISLYTSIVYGGKCKRGNSSVWMLIL